MLRNEVLRAQILRSNLPEGRYIFNFYITHFPSAETISRCSMTSSLPSEDEVDYAIARAATEKSPGVDGIPIEAFKIIRESDVLFGEFMKFLHARWREDDVDPEAFHTAEKVKSRHLPLPLQNQAKKSFGAHVPIIN